MGSRLTRRQALGRTLGSVSALVVSARAQDQVQHGTIPPGVVTLEDFEPVARQRLDPQTFEIVRGGAADELTLRWNRQAFERIRLRPRVLVDVSRLTTTLALFGQQLESPVILAPAGVHGRLHPDGELETARGAAPTGTVLVIPSAPTRPVEDVARLSRAAPWYQLYVGRDRGRTREEAQRAENAGCRVLFVTVDSAAAGVRNGMMRPPFRAMQTPGEFQTIADPSFSWKDLSWLHSVVRMPIVLKGILDPADAERAVTEGASGIAVSNHGGRQLDSVPATIDALPAVVDRVGGRVPVLMDGGIRRGTDVLKALANGASAVMIGRPFLYGLAVAGADGVDRIVTILRQEFEIAMALAGRESLAKIDRTALW
jgi:4-hydroxymandelate oxidase